jgi:hypothetical protein
MHTDHHVIINQESVELKYQNNDTTVVFDDGLTSIG